MEKICFQEIKGKTLVELENNVNNFLLSSKTPIKKIMNTKLDYDGKNYTLILMYKQYI